MSDANLKTELKTAPVEPLLPIELLLIKTSLGIGVILLIILGVISRAIG